VQGAFGLVDDHLVAAPDENGHRACVGAFFDHQHLLPRGAETHLAHYACLAEFRGAEVFEARDDPAVGGDGDEFDFRAADPADGGEFVL